MIHHTKDNVYDAYMNFHRYTINPFLYNGLGTYAPEFFRKFADRRFNAFSENENWVDSLLLELR